MFIYVSVLVLTLLNVVFWRSVNEYLVPRLGADWGPDLVLRLGADLGPDSIPRFGADSGPDLVRRFRSDLGLDLVPRFTVLDKFEFWVSLGMLRAAFWEVFGDPGITVPRFLRYRK